jgi:hypothetical protein
MTGDDGWPFEESLGEILDPNTWAEIPGTVRRLKDGSLLVEYEDGSGFLIAPDGRRLPLPVHR